MSIYKDMITNGWKEIAGVWTTPSDRTPECYHYSETVHDKRLYGAKINHAKVKRADKNKWRVQCDYKDCPKSAWPTSGKTKTIALTKWFIREHQNENKRCK